MILDCNPGIQNKGSAVRTRIQDPSKEDLRAALQAVGTQDDWFVILQRDDVYVQCEGVDPDSIRVEYREDGTQYRSRKRLPVDHVQRIFEAFYRGDVAWKEETEWQAFDLGTADPSSDLPKIPVSLDDFFDMKESHRYIWLVAAVIILASVVVYFTT